MEDDDEPCDQCGGERVRYSETPDGDFVLRYCPDCGMKEAVMI
jgi:hypothetical protein